MKFWGAKIYISGKVLSTEKMLNLVNGIEIIHLIKRVILLHLHSYLWYLYSCDIIFLVCTPACIAVSVRASEVLKECQRETGGWRGGSKWLPTDTAWLNMVRSSLCQRET